MAVGGVALFPSDTVYGLACDVHNRIAVERLYRLKRRPLDKPSAVMFFDLELALAALPELGPRTRSALERLLPGAVTVLLPNPDGRFSLACGADQTLGLRVPALPELQGVSWPVLQSSANFAGGPEARRLEQVPAAIRRAAELVIDGGELPGTHSTVVDLRNYERGGADAVRVVRPGALSDAAVAEALGGEFHFNPATYGEMLRADYPEFDDFQERVAAACGPSAHVILELGIGTGETARRLRERFPDAALVGIDESAEMLEAARRALGGAGAQLRVARLQDPLPEGPFDLVASALCVHHLDAAEKADLFQRVHAALRPGGRFVLADVVVPANPADAAMPLTPGFDKPSSVADQLLWLADAGFDARVVWDQRDVAIIVADA